MKATTWIDWERVTLEFGASAIEEVIARCGWTIVNGFTEMTDANRAELARIEEQGYAEIVTLPAFQAKAWWDAHVAARVVGRIVTSTGAGMNRPEIQAAALRQYGHFKGKHPTCVLFFRMGDFYEAYNDDAVTVARVLELPVTRREEPQPGEPAAVAGISYKEIDAQLKRLLKAGYRVALCEQVASNMSVSKGQENPQEDD